MYEPVAFFFVRLMVNGKPFTIINPWSFVESFRIMAVKTLKKSVPLRDSEVQTFLEGGKHKIQKRKTESFVFNGFGNFIFSQLRTKNRQLEDLPQVDFGRVPERFLLSVRTNSITENFVHWKLGLLFVFVVIQRMFSSRVRQRTLRFVSRDCWSFYFHSLIKLIFLVSKGLLT